VCTRAVSALAHYLEEEGLATVAISLIRPQTENTKPPRALWVPFELGRPFGPPNDPEFQKRVVRTALQMLELEHGPVVIEDFPEPLILRFALDDLKAYYLEAAAAGTSKPSSQQLGDWLWDQTAAGAAILALREASLTSEDERLRLIAGNFMVPAVRVPAAS